MKMRLTISINKKLTHFAKLRARIYSKSVSSLLSEYLLEQRAQSTQQALPWVRAMVGVLKNYNIDDSKAAIRASNTRKYVN